LLAAVVLFVSSTIAFGENAANEAKVLGVGRIQSDPNAGAANSSQRLIVPTEEENAQPYNASALAVPTDRDVVLRQAPPARPAAPESSGGSGDSGYGGGYGEWQTGQASAYGGYFIGRTTHYGNVLTEESMGVAVPQSWSYLLGTYVEIEYNGMTVICMIDDTGAFAQYGRVLDLQPGVWKYFGFNDPYDWGVRTVRYRLLG